MNLQWPGFLALLILIPLLIAAYIWMLRRKRRFAVRYSSLSIVRQAMPQYSRFRRHFPFALFLAALGSLILALARPIVITAIPTNQTTIILAMDVSGSMCAVDIEPSRIEAAQAAAIQFIENQKASTQIGIVAFSGFAELVRPPTTDRQKLIDAINSLLTGRGTAIGSGIVEAIDTIADIDPSVPKTSLYRDASEQPPAVPEGFYVPDIIVVLTDGVATTGPLPLDAAQQAADRGIRVYTIGFGTTQGAEFAGCGRRWMGRQPFQGGGGGGMGGGGGRFRRGIDEDTLIQVADMTGGEYYSAESASQLQDVFMNLPTSLIMKHEATEVSVMFTALGAVFVALAFILAFRWQPLL
jgi:Ca-activated chloride channel family protein